MPEGRSAGPLMQGNPGSTINLTVFQVRRPEPAKIKLTRTAIVLPSVEEKPMAGQVGYIAPPVRSASKVKDLAAAVDRLQKQGAQKLVLDLRDIHICRNSGCSVRISKPIRPRR